MKIRHLPFVLALVGLSFLSPSVLRASHIVGGVITYTFIKRDTVNPKLITYHFTLKVYRDIFGSNGTQLDARANIAILLQNANGAYALYRSKQIPISSTKTLDINKPPCSEVPANIGVEEGIYEWDEQLVESSTSYAVTYQRCCRNNTIANIYNPGTTGATYTVEITAESQRTNNNSPVFNNFPPSVICANESLNYDHSATDTEGDQLVYSFCGAFIGGSSGGTPGPTPAGNNIGKPPYSFVNYRLPNYSINAPIGGSPIVKINSNTGIITGTPNVLGQFVVTVCVEEYRNGVLIGKIFRDFQFNVVSCRRTVVTAITSDSTAGKEFYVSGCENVTLTIDNQSYDRANISSFYWEFDMRGNKVRFNDWSPTVVFSDTGVYKGVLRLNPNANCSDSAFVTVKVGGKLFPTFNVKYDTCVAGAVAFTGDVRTSIPLKSMFWDYGDGFRDTNSLVTSHFFKTPGTKNVLFAVKDRVGCIGDTTISFNWQPAPPILIVEPNTFAGCAPATVSFVNRSTPIDTTYKIIWDFGDGTFGSAISPKHIYTYPDTFSIKLMITSPIGCYKEAIFRSWIKVKSVPKADFDWSPKVINNLNPSVSFRDSSSADVIGWRWYFSEKAYSSQKNPPFTYRDTGIQTVKLYVTNQNGCVDSIFKTLYIEPEMTFHFPNAFSPNYDSVNDVFKGTGFLYGMKSYRMLVWNRWGEKIFESTNPNEGWNGQKNNVGIQVPEGIYLFEVEYVTPKNKRVLKRDFLTLYR
ncbi:MAG: gliding motility-associated C-terminal domain-containing protein [Saprospiraceae bacterium]|nr:gliding motility-associated C-terminal domain-containing protein [Saprospiraceae bacterium]